MALASSTGVATVCSHRHGPPDAGVPSHPVTHGHEDAGDHRGACSTADVLPYEPVACPPGTRKTATTWLMARYQVRLLPAQTADRASDRSLPRTKDAR